MWILGRPKSHYYGAYPEGFLWRAKALVPGHALHLCSGKLNPYFPIDKAAIDGDDTLDINPSLTPTFVADATATGLPSASYSAILLDRPYTENDAEHYGTSLPDMKELMQEADRLLKPQGRLGVLDYIIPRPVNNLRLLATVSVFVGFGNRIRAFTVYEKKRSKENGTSLNRGTKN